MVVFNFVSKRFLSHEDLMRRQRKQSCTYRCFQRTDQNLKEKNPKWSRTTLDCELSTTRTLFMEENSDGERLN